MVAQSTSQFPLCITDVYGTGDQTGATATMTLFSSGTPLSRHFFFPSEPLERLGDADQRYLEAKGVFSFPRKDTCNELLRAYFHHIHPTMPIIEADVILGYQSRGKLHEYNVLLLWCIFAIATDVRMFPSSVLMLFATCTPTPHPG